MRFNAKRMEKITLKNSWDFSVLVVDFFDKGGYNGIKWWEVEQSGEFFTLSTEFSTITR